MSFKGDGGRSGGKTERARENQSVKRLIIGEMTDRLCERERERVMLKQRNNKGLREERLVFAGRGGRVKRFGWSQLQPWLCGVMSLAVSHASVFLSLAGTGGGCGTALWQPWFICVFVWTQLLYFLQILDNKSVFCSVFIYDSFTVSHLLSFASVSFCSCSSSSSSSTFTIHVLMWGRGWLVALGNTIKPTDILLEVRQDLSFTLDDPGVHDLHPKPLLNTSAENSSAAFNLWCPRPRLVSCLRPTQLMCNYNLYV